MVEGMVQAPGEITQDDKLWALLSWLFWPVALVALLMEDKKQRPFVKYSAVQSLALAVVGLVIGTITLGCGAILWIIYVIILAIQSYQGNWVKIPLITDFCKKQGWV
jgi:uncharacterized membrane protein